MPIPTNSPVVLLPVVCQCGCCQLMVPEVEFTAKGTVVSVTYYCDVSKYALVSSHQYLVNQVAKYKEPDKRKSIAQAAAEARERAKQPAPPAPKPPAPTIAPVPNVAEAVEGDAAALAGKAVQS